MVGEKLLDKIELPRNTTAVIEGMQISLKGKNGGIKKWFNAKGISFRQENNSIVIEAKPATRRMNSLLRTIKSHIENMVEGIQNGYQYRLAIVYSHFPMNVGIKEKTVEIKNFTGEKQPRTARIIGDTRVEVKGKEIIVSGINKEAVGQTAANLENATRVIGKDRRIYQDGIYITEKAIVENQ